MKTLADYVLHLKGAMPKELCAELIAIYDETQEIAVFNTLNKAKELCEMSNEFVIDENENILYRGKQCSSCFRNLRHPNDIVDDCDNCSNTGEVKCSN